MERMLTEGCCLECTRIVPKVHVVNLLRHDRRDYGGLYGQFLHLQENLRSLSRELGQGFAEMLREGPGAKLGKVPFRGPRASRSGTL
jgi:hypothetical protein